MGVNDHIEPKKRGKNRGQSKRGRVGAGEGYEISLAAAIECMSLATVLANAGGALRIGKTRDGGALALGVYYGEDYGTEYVRPNEDIGEAVDEILTAWIPDRAAELVAAREHLYGLLARQKQR